jgi:ATP-dependent DNA ligase
MQSAYKTDLSAIPTSCILDGELVDGVLWVFDLPYLADKAGPIDPSHILSVRRAALEEMFTWWTPNPACFRLLPVAHLDLDKSKLALTVLQNGGEGLMLKDTMGTYRSGARVKDVCKVKFVKTIDCVVTAVGTQGKENYSLGVYRPTNAPGAMSNGRFELVEVGRCSAIGKAKVNVGDVIEVKYLYLGADNRLYQPRMMRPRTDKGALECTIDQLDHAKVNKTVVERWSA